jgi:anti-anti-sigma factor
VVDGAGILTLRGEIDLAVETPLRVAFDQACSAEKPIVVNLRGVDFMDSTGLAVFVMTRNRLHARGHHLVVAEPIERVQQVIHLTALDTVIPIFDTESEALAYCSTAKEP